MPKFDSTAMEVYQAAKSGPAILSAKKSKNFI